MVVVGAGNLGTALSHYSGFNTGGFRIVGIVDSDPQKVGTPDPRRPDRGAGRRADRDRPRARGRTSASSPCPRAPPSGSSTSWSAAGVQAVLNFAPTQLKEHPDVKVRNVDLKVNLEFLSFFLRHPQR